MELTALTWNLFRGRSQPPLRADLLPAFAGALAAREWDVAALQEVPTWWPAELARRTGASVRVARTSLARAVLAPLQAEIHRRDPERIGVRGAGVNALLVRPSAGRIDDHRTATLRWLPQRRTVHGVLLRRAAGDALWVVNVHAHNRPPAAAERDVALALAHARRWSSATPGLAGSTPAPAAAPGRALVLGDLNLRHAEAHAAAARAGLTLLAGSHVDGLLGLGVERVGEPTIDRVLLRPGGPALSDHRLVQAKVR
ncbi:MAG: endonuclease/exonuclease/phosphatase family protein [Patulibacter minatonensis]